MQQSSFDRSIVAFAIACLLLAGIPSAMAEDGTNATASIGGTIIVMSFPQGASVSLNGEYRGIAPLRLVNVTPGNYEIGISKAGYNNDSVPVVLYDGSTREIGFTLEPASSSPAIPAGSGSVAVDSNPGGAMVRLDGNAVGQTPAGRAALILNNVPAGSHVVTVELAGYPVYSTSVTVIKNQVARVNADFETRSPTVPGTPIITTDRPEPVPVSPLTVLVAACLAGLAAIFRRA